MLEPREADIPVLFLVLVVLPLAAYILLGKWSDAAEKRERVSLLAQLASEETQRAEAMKASCAITHVPTPRNGIHVCARCFCPATTRCARCKSVRYCSGKCQIIHWRQVHQHECQQLETTSSGSSLKASSTEDCRLEGFSVSDSVNSFHVRSNNKQGMVDSAQLDDVVDPLMSTGATAANSFFAVDTSQGAMLHRSSIDRRVSCKSNSEMLIRAEGAGFVPLKETSEIRSINTTKLAKQDNSVCCGTYDKAKVLFPYEEYMRIFNCGFVSLSPKGLLNCGNSCYANAVLQCLTCTKPLVIFLLRRSHSRSCFGKDWCLMCELEQLVTVLTETGGPLSPSRILLHMQNSSCQIGDGNQEDAHEFLRLLVASMQSICLEGLGGEEKVDPRLQETTFIQHTFGGRLRSKVKCLRCHRESERYEKIMDLTLEIFGWVESLEDALTQFTSSEELDGENMYRCGRCAAYVRARKQLSIDEAPNILTIVLKRFKEGKYGKINKCISFPEMLDMTPFMTEMGDDTPLYMLYAVVVHLDTLNASFTGHYIAYVKDLQGSWFRIDDTEVHPVPIDHVMSEGAYILFYMRACPRPPRAFNQIAIGQKVPKYARHILSRTQKSSRQRQSESSCHFVGSEHSLDLKPQNITGLSSHACGILKKNTNRDVVHVDFSDATSSDRSIFTSSDDASFTTESTRDSFSTMDNIDMFSSIFNNLSAPEPSSSSTICCRTFPSGNAETRYFSEEKGYVLDSFFSNHPAKRIWRMEKFKKVSDSLAEVHDGSYESVQYGSSMSRTSSHCKQ